MNVALCIHVRLPLILSGFIRCKENNFLSAPNTDATCAPAPLCHVRSALELELFPALALEN